MLPPRGNRKLISRCFIRRQECFEWPIDGVGAEPTKARLWDLFRNKIVEIENLQGWTLPLMKAGRR